MKQDKHVKELIHALTAPTIVADKGWAETLPEWIRSRITLERLAHNIRLLNGEANAEEATNAEVVAYLYTASLTAPLSHNYTEIYLNLASKYTEVDLGKPLNEDQKRVLGQLKRDIYKTQKKHLKKARRK